MLLLIVLALVLIAVPAAAEPISAAILIGVGVSASSAGFATAVAVTTAVLSAVGSFGLSFVASALLKPAGKGGTGAAAAPSTALDSKQSIRQPIAPHQVIYGRTRVSGIFADMFCNSGNQILVAPIVFAGHECEQIEYVQLGESPSYIDPYGNVVTGRYAGNVNIALYHGRPDQQADWLLLRDAPWKWTPADKGTGLTYARLTMYWDNSTGMGNPGDGTFQISHLGAKLWNNGVPNITAVIKGKRVYDPRSGLTAWTDNAALIVADFLCDAEYGYGVDYASGIDEAALIAAADACDEPVPLAAGGTEKRYTINGFFTTDTAPDETLGRLLGAMHGKAIRDGDRWRILAGVYQTPTLTLTDDHMRKGSQLQTVTSAQDAFNAVKGTYVGEFFQPTDFPAIESDVFREQDGGFQKVKDIQLPFTNSVSGAQRIAKIDLLKARQEIVETFRGKLSCWRVTAGTTILRSSARYGWVDKPFEVASVTVVPDQDANGTPILGVDLVLKETDPSVYDWATSEEQEVDPAPNTQLPDIFNVLPPSNLTAAESLYATRDGGGVKARIVLAWDASPDSFVKVGGAYQAEYRLAGTTAWTRLPRTTATTIEIADIDPGTYDFRVASVNWADNLSPYIAVMGRFVAGLGAAPVAPANLTLVPNGNFATLRWDFPPDLDVQIGGVIVFRHAAQLAGASWADGTTISKPLPASLTFAVLPLVAGTYMAKYRDAAGVWSEGFVSFPTAQSGALDFDELVGGSLVEDPGFAGSRSNCSVEAGKLKLGGAGLFSDIPLLSSVPTVAYWGGVRTSGTYGWSQPIDLGSKTRCRITVSKQTLVTNVFDLISQRTGTVGSWPRFGGSVAGDEADAHTEVRFTDDDPAGPSPAWSAWARLDVGEFDARGFELRTRLQSNDGSFDIEISALSAIAEEIV